MCICVHTYTDTYLHACLTHGKSLSDPWAWKGLRTTHGKPVAVNDALLSMNQGLIQGIVADCLGYLAFQADSRLLPGMSCSQGRQADPTKMSGLLSL